MRTGGLGRTSHRAGKKLELRGTGFGVTHIGNAAMVKYSLDMLL